VLRVVSELRDDEGVVYFNNGRVVQATARRGTVPIEAALLQSGRISPDDLARARAQQTNGHTGVPSAEVLIEMGAVSAKEVERQLRSQLQTVVFDLMSWREGYFSFEERPRTDIPETRIAVSTESLLMETARRVDEWSRISDMIPNINVIPELAPIEGDREGPAIDILPHEWQVLSMIDGARDLREISRSLDADDFEIAKIAYGLACTGVIVVRPPNRATVAPDDASTDRRLATARALGAAGKHADAADELRRAAQDDPATPRVHLDLAFALARCGDLKAACASWEQFLHLAPTDTQAGRVRAAIIAAQHLQNLIETHANE
jgi:tetratricopeptide (TPR) repeat protein